MRYIKISNIGEIEINAFKLIGASSKRNDSSKIGFFGSGLKYALAYFLRENTELHVFSGETKINITTRSTVHRGTEFKIIQINGEDTSLTTDMGPKWGAWGAIREIYCNAIDEGANDITIVDGDSIKGSPDNTTFFIGVTPALMEVIENWSDYFCKDRTDTVSSQNNSETGIATIKESPLDSEKNTVYYAGIQRNLIIYRRGVQCHMSASHAFFNYDFSWVNINESREIGNFYLFKEQLVTFFAQSNNENLIRTLLIALHENNDIFESFLNWQNISVLSTDTWRAAIGTKTLVPLETSGWYTEKIEKNPNQYLLLPSKLVDSLVEHLPDISVLGKRIGINRFLHIDRTEKHEFLLNSVLSFFNDAKYVVNYPIEVVKFQDSYIISDSHDGTIYLADHLFLQGKHKLAEYIFLENELLVMDLHKLSTAFNDHVIAKAISILEEKTCFFL